MKNVKFLKTQFGEAIIETTTQALANLGWCFDHTELSEKEYIDRYPNTDLYFRNSENGYFCGMINYDTDQERRNYTSEPTENSSDDYTNTLKDIIILLQNDDAEIYADDGEMFEII